ncbi:MAG: hypothetical protein ABI806_28400 [Candidatus Solibacter sp.]
MAKSKVNSSPVWLWVAAIVLAATDAFVIFWTPGPGDYKSPLAVPAVSFFLVIIILVIVSERAGHRLVREIRAPAAAIVPAPEKLPLAGPPPAYSGATEILSAERGATLSPAAAALAKHGRRIFDQSIGWNLLGIWVLLAGTLLMTMLGSGALPFASGLVSATLVVTVAARLVSPWIRQNTLTYLVSLALHAVWLTATVFVVGTSCLSAVTRGAAAVPGAVAGVATLALYAFLMQRRTVQLRASMLARPPVRLLFLWVFGDFQRLNSLFLGLGAIWRCVGSLQLLRGGWFLATAGESLRGRRNKRGFLASTPDEASALIAGFHHEPHRWMFLYATNSLLCTDSAWRQALDALLDETDVVLMDLSGFSPSNQGCTYELGQLVDRIPTSRMVLLVDTTTDLGFLRTTLQAACGRMAAGSPNRSTDYGPVKLFQLRQEYVKGKTSLIAIQKDAQNIFDLLCEAASIGK